MKKEGSTRPSNLPIKGKYNHKADDSEPDVSPGLRHGRSFSSHNFEEIDKYTPEQQVDTKGKEKDNNIINPEKKAEDEKAVKKDEKPEENNSKLNAQP